MIPEIATPWNENKHKLENYFRTTKQSEYDRCGDIGMKIFELCIPRSTSVTGWDYILTQTDDTDWTKELGDISGSTTGLPTPEQVKRYMSLALAMADQIERVNEI